jgi:hypothetical protein
MCGNVFNFDRRRFWLCFALATCCLLGRVCVGAELPDSSCDLWVVSTRQASSCQPSLRETGHLAYWNLRENCRWHKTSREEFFRGANGDDSQAPLPLCVYVHENRVTAGEAFSRAILVQRKLQAAAPQGSRFRLVVISWPSDRIGVRPRPDVQIKARRSEVHGYYLAWLLDQLDPRTQISLFGHSFGPRVIASALHLLGGGSLDGFRLTGRVHPQRLPMQAVFLAAAFDTDALLPGHQFGQALAQLDHLLISQNPCDPVLHWYPHMYGRRGPQSLGYVGLTASRLRPADQPKVRQINVARFVGKSHHWQDYECSSAMLSRIMPYLLPNEKQGKGQDSLISTPGPRPADSLAITSPTR